MIIKIFLIKKKLKLLVKISVNNFNGLIINVNNFNGLIINVNNFNGLIINVNNFNLSQ